MDERDEDRIKLAKAKLRLSLVCFIGGIVLLSSQTFFKGVFKWENQKEVANVDHSISQNDFSYEPIPFDSTECVDGIHIPTGMVADTGCAEVIQNCGACHSLELVRQNRATAEGWKEIIEWMQETQKLWDLGAKEPVIIKYLAKNYGPESEGRRKNLVVDEWYDL